MPEPQTSTDGGQASTSGTGQAPTPTTDGQAPVSQPTEHERIITELRKENAAARKRIETFESLQKEAELAKLGETEKLQKQNAELQEHQEALAAQLHDALVYQEVARYAAKFNFVVSVETLADLLLLRDERTEDGKIEFENGKPANIEKLLDKLAKAETKLVEQQSQQQPQRAPAVPAMNPGRSTIGQPGGNVPGRIPRLTDPGMFKTP